MVPELEQRSAPPAEHRCGGKRVPAMVAGVVFHFLTKSEKAVWGPDPDFDIKGPGDLMVMMVKSKRGRL